MSKMKREIVDKDSCVYNYHVRDCIGAAQVPLLLLLTVAYHCYHSMRTSQKESDADVLHIDSAESHAVLPMYKDLGQCFVLIHTRVQLQNLANRLQLI